LGDVGSIPLGFLLISLTLILAMKIESINPLIFFLVYMIDSGWTIGQRLLNKENILKPHRKHLYQLMVNECGMNHLIVSTIYFSIQMLVNLVYILNFENFQGNWFLPLIFVVFSLFYIATKVYLLRKIARKTIISSKMPNHNQ
jgi:UDP-N-acetylmuramyl pentapeptide phosphotransferase/UDP-N-acetylglucosamine-1-phosphate transferase